MCAEFALMTTDIPLLPCFLNKKRIPNIKYIQEQLGHGSIKVTMGIYGNLFEGEHRHLVERLDNPETTESATQPQPPLEVKQALHL